jgi:O-antigen/teichoic acid export membrane protein
MTHWDLAPRYLAEGTTNSAAMQLRNYGIVWMLGLATMGAVQAATTLMGPFMVVFFGLGLVMVPEGVRVLRRSPRHLLRLSILSSIGLSALAAVWGVALLITLPMGLGQALFGSLWHDAYPLIVPATLGVMALGVTAGAGLSLHALGVARQSLRAMIVTSAVYVACSLLGAAISGAGGSLTGGAIALWLGALVYWLEVRIAMREALPAPSQPAVDFEADGPADVESSTSAQLPA